MRLVTGEKFLAQQTIKLLKKLLLGPSELSLVQMEQEMLVMAQIQNPLLRENLISSLDPQSEQQLFLTIAHVRL